MVWEPNRTDVCIQVWYGPDEDRGVSEGSWDTPRFLRESDLSEGYITQSIDLLMEHELGAVEIVLSYEDKVRLGRPERVYLNVYLAQQAYGGPEEGGWWYDTEEPCENECRDVTDLPHEARIALLREVDAQYSDETVGRDYTSVLARGMHRVRLEPHVAEHSPKRRPHYE